MRAVASRVSSAVAVPAHGVVHSVFEHAVNISAAGELFSVVTASVGGVPNGLVLAQEVDLTEYARGGHNAERDGDALRAGGLRIDLRPATPWDPCLRVRGQLPRDLEVPLAHCGFPAKQAAPRIEALITAVRAHDPQATRKAAQGLVGLGQGLTPSGDDFLVGFSAALCFIGSQPLSYSYNGTTDVAQAFHRHAQRGEFTERIHRFFETWDVEEALQWGATSGADCLLGVLSARVACDIASRLPF